MTVDEIDTAVQTTLWEVEVKTDESYEFPSERLARRVGNRAYENAVKRWGSIRVTLVEFPRKSILVMPHALIPRGVKHVEFHW